MLKLPYKHEDAIMLYRVWMCIRILSEGEVVKKGTNEKEIKEFFAELKNIKVAIEA